MIDRERTGRRGKSPVTSIVILVILILAGISSDNSEFFITILAIAIFFAPLAIILYAIKKAGKTMKKSTEHTHDRIDHSTDLKINPKTGKTINTGIKTAGQHSAREHWKQQLDGLLENGTIDREEYRKLMDRKF